MHNPVSTGKPFGPDGQPRCRLQYQCLIASQQARGCAFLLSQAYFIGGFGMTALTANDIVLVPIRSGVGFRLGANVGYLKFTPQSTWNPF
jgi:hypothetical protein